MKSVNFKLKALSAIVAAGMMLMAGAASAQTVVGGGATLPQPLYYDIFYLSPALVLGTWSYTGTGSGAGKKAFLTNNPQATLGSEFYDENTRNRPIWPASTSPTPQTVHFVGSDSALTSSELDTYMAAYNNGPVNNGALPGSTVAYYGRLIQVPVVATPVLLPYRETNVTTLNLTTEQICRIFSFQLSARNWSQVTTAADDGGVGTANAIQVVYRTGTSGTTELLSNFLHASCGSYLPSGKSFTVSNDFKTVVASALPTLTAAQDANADGIPDVWVAATGSSGVETAAAVNHRLAYLSPSYLFSGTDNSAVAKINGFQPDAASIQAALPAPPASTETDPLKWVPAYATTSTAYPIYGTTNLLLGQCYAAGVGTGTAGAAVKDFLTKFNNGTYDTKITANNFVKLPTAWNDAINAAFLTSTSSQALGNTSVCNGIGRP